MQRLGCFDMTEVSMAWSVGKKEGRKWPLVHCLHPQNAAPASDGQYGREAAV